MYAYRLITTGNTGLAHPSGVERQDLKLSLHGRLLESLRPEALSSGEPTSEEIREAITLLLRTVGDLTDAQRSDLLEELLEEALGLGPIAVLLKDPTVSEILVATPRLVFVERSGRLIRVPVELREADIARIMEKLLSLARYRPDDTSPLVEVPLPDGSRLTAVTRPVALDGPSLVIRRRSAYRFPPEELIESLAWIQQMHELAKACVRAGLNVLVSGGAGSGRLTLLNVLAGFIFDRERIIALADAADFEFTQPHVVRLDARATSGGRQVALSPRQLIAHAQRMRPDRIVFGELTGDESLDALQAMTRGHCGLAALHADDPYDAVRRLELMVSMAQSGMSQRTIRQLMVSAVDLIIHVDRLRDGARRVTHVTEITGMEHDQIVLRDVFAFSEGGVPETGRVTGRFFGAGSRPIFWHRMAAMGIHLPESMFHISLEVK